MENKYIYTIGLLLIGGLTLVLAQGPKMVDPKDEELNSLMMKSEQRLKKINVIVKQIDQVSSSQVSNMKESIESLKTEKEQLKTKLNEVTVISNDIAASPFKLEPIVSDSTY
jgi:ABC-type phosphate transport system auxiliary subunit